MGTHGLVLSSLFLLLHPSTTEQSPIPAWRCSTLLPVKRDFPPPLLHVSASSIDEDAKQLQLNGIPLNFNVQAPKLALHAILSGSEGVKVTLSPARKAIHVSRHEKPHAKWTDQTGDALRDLHKG